MTPLYTNKKKRLPVRKTDLPSQFIFCLKIPLLSMAAGLLFANSSAEVKNPAYYKHRKGKMVLHAQKYQANIRDHYSTGSIHGKYNWM